MATIPFFFSLVLFLWHYFAYKLQKKQGGQGYIATEDAASKPDSPQGDDEVLPVHFIDQAAIVRTSIINYTFRYNDVLDASKLHRGLLHLLQIPGWNKLGGRLRATSGGKLEIHVPKTFSRSRPAVKFSHVDLSDTRIEIHHLASQLPVSTGSLPSVQEGCHAFRTFALPADLPNNIDHYWKNDQPLLCLHVTSFANATLVGFTFPHSLSDAMGTSELLKAWSNVVAGKSCLVKPLHGTHVDVLGDVGTAFDKKASGGEFVLERQQTRAFSLLSFIVRYVWDVTTRRSIRTRHIYLPAKYMRHLRHSVEEELRRKNRGVAPFVSDGDLITAWGSRMVISSSPWRNCSAVICNVFDLRGRLKNTFTPGGTYLQNLILPATTVLSRDETANATTAQIAWGLRKAILEQTEDVQARRLMRLARQWFASMGMMPLFAGWDSRVIACTNWTKAKFLDAADFGPTALVSLGNHKPNGPTRKAVAEGARPGRPVMYWGTTLSVTDSPRDTFVIYGKDAAGNYWIHAYLREETWDLIQKELLSFR
ncbi:lysR family regulatory protein [Colletotrichum tofieldiae]|uniref:LYSR family regulatory protein (BCL5p) n=1 Tax=Colletotrichum tofieldiae TaxID=708197 RepID=A0A166N182_9PEZI|nr:LYSR family regulatory protein (BCL5p) [Colletotrichum tofieldiae]GKT60936.1 LysR family regulatory protein [Colletotrichum tofieldiae]GKT68631.1 lysR family regulatory protein [Colletotrichum tofieldiae]